jgi:uncharacterized alpha-E superfamily protein
VVPGRDSRAKRDCHAPDGPRRAECRAAHGDRGLGALSAFEVYRKVYRESVTPLRVTELLLLNAEMPRSVHRCRFDLLGNLQAVNSQSAETERMAGELHAQFLDRFQGRLNMLADRISADFLVAGYSG